MILQRKASNGALLKKANGALMGECCCVENVCTANDPITATLAGFIGCACFNYTYLSDSLSATIAWDIDGTYSIPKIFPTQWYLDILVHGSGWLDSDCVTGEADANITVRIQITCFAGSGYSVQLNIQPPYPGWAAFGGAVWQSDAGWGPIFVNNTPAFETCPSAASGGASTITLSGL